MNKLFTKIVGVALGLTMAIGVGVAVASNSKEVTTVRAVDSDPKYSLINSTADLEVGKSYLITNGTSGKVKTMSTTNNGNNRPTTEATVDNDGKITRGSSVMSISLGGSTGAWTWHTDNYAGTGGYLGQGNQTSSNYLKIYSTVGDGTAGDTWTISFSGDAAVITSTKKTSRNVIRCNDNGTPISCYTNGQKAVYLFKEVSTYTVTFNTNGGDSISSQTVDDGTKITLPEPTYSGHIFVNWSDGTSTYDAGEEVTINDNTTFTASWTEVKDLSSISLSGTYKTSFAYGESFDHSGLVVTANYSGSTTADVSNKATVSGYNATTAGNQTITVSYTEGEVTKTATYTVTVAAKVGVTSVALNKDSTSIEVGSTETLTVTVLPTNAYDPSVTWSTDNASVATVSNGVVTAEAKGTANITVTSVDDNTKTDSCAVTVTQPSTITDTLTTSSVGSPSSYTSWSNISGTSGAKYAGQSTGGTNYIQLRATSPSGIVTTTSGGSIGKVSVTWNSATTSGRTLNVYGKNSAYSSSSNLYDSSTQGTLLGTIVYGTSTELTVTGSYAYVGVVSNSGALYLDNISFLWNQEQEATSELESIEITLDENKLVTEYYVGDEISLSGVDVIAHYTDSSEDKSIITSTDLTLVYDETAILNMTEVTIMAEYEGEEDSKSFGVTVKEDSVTSITVSGTSDSQFDIFEGEQLTSTIVNTWTLNVNWESEKAQTHPSYGGNDGYSLTTNTCTDQNPFSLPYTWKKGDTQLTFSYGSKTCNKTVIVTPTLHSITASVSGDVDESFTASNAGWSNGEVISSWSGDGFAIEFNKGSASNDCAYFTSDETARVYKNGNFVISSSYTISKLVFSSLSGTISASPGNLSSGTWTGSATSITFSVSANAKFKGVTATYYAEVEKTINNDPDYKPAQRAVIEYADDFNSRLSLICVAYGSTDSEDLKTEWDLLAEQFGNWFKVSGTKNLAEDQVIRAKLMFANAKYTDRDSALNDSLQAMLGKYDEILSHYDFDDFLHDSTDRGEAPQAASRIAIFGNIGTANATAIIVVISLVSLTAIGGYFFLRKRKED